MYNPLHHKYRPQTFADLVGQNAIAQTLTNAITSNRIVPAYLFAGPRGTGKTSSARILAKSLNCLASNQPTSAPCGECHVCQGIAHGSLLDIIEIDAASNSGVENIRELIEKAQFAPVQCRYKVYVVDECHSLSGSAAQALLKTLEEPPQNVIFVLCTTEPQKLPNTIISRCQRHNFRRIAIEPMVQHLRAIANSENIDITDEAVWVIAQLAQGGLRDAETLLDQLSLLPGQITQEQVWDLVGAVPEQELMELLDAIARKEPQSVLNLTRAILDRGKEPMVILQNLIEFYTHLVIAKTSPQSHELAQVTPLTWDSLVKLANSWDTQEILSGQQQLRTCAVQVKSTSQPRLWLEVALLGLLSEAPPTTAPSCPPAAGSTSLWEAVVAMQPPAIRALLTQHGTLAAFDGTNACIRMRSAPLQQRVAGDVAALEAAFGKVASKKVKVTVTS